MGSFRVASAKVAQETRNSQPKPQRMGWKITTADGMVEMGRYDDARVAHTQATRLAKSGGFAKYQLWENAGSGTWVKVAEYESMNPLPLPAPAKNPEAASRAVRAARILASVAQGITSEARWADAMRRPEVTCLRRHNNA